MGDYIQSSLLQGQTSIRDLPIALDRTDLLHLPIEHIAIEDDFHTLGKMGNCLIDERLEAFRRV